jgi:hypothetical protein
VPSFSTTATSDLYSDIVFVHTQEVRLDTYSADTRFPRTDMNVKIQMLLQDSSIPMNHVGTVLGLSLKGSVQTQTAAILYRIHRYRIHRGLLHHTNPTYRYMTEIVQVFYQQVQRLKGEFAGTLRLSMRSNSSLLHHILHT